MNTLSRLTTSFVVEELAHNDSPRVVRKLIKRRREIILACILTQTYGYFATMMLHRSLALSKESSYKDAEKLADLFGFIFDSNIKPECMLHYPDEELNKALDNYDNMCHCISILDQLGIKREDVTAFCKAVEYDRGFNISWYKIQCCLHYKYYTDALLSFLLDFCSYKEMEEQFFKYSLFMKKKSFVNVRPFIKDLRMVLDLFYYISTKRAFRDKRRSLLLIAQAQTIPAGHEVNGECL